jgi:hypothetical protein
MGWEEKERVYTGDEGWSSFAPHIETCVVVIFPSVSVGEVEKERSRGEGNERPYVTLMMNDGLYEHVGMLAT